jgi:sterol desaturase/sphingolipid hydroxylase (fatty acid hydroxylase superfamily)
MGFEDVIGLIIPASFFLFLGIEARWPARAYPTRRWWRLRGVGFLIVMAVIATALPLALPEPWLAAHRLLDLSAVPLVPATLLGYAVVSGISYAWHRATHRSPFLWRWFHQLHHSPVRMDMGGAAVFHPFDVATYVLLSTVTTTLVLGLSPHAAALTGLVAQLYSFFQHMNVRTPAWLGYFIQRPEAHFVHHRRDVHAYNYGDLPIWDLLFGTFRNPATFGDEDVGFPAPADGRYGAMLVGVDVSDSVGTVVQRSTTVD